MRKKKKKTVLLPVPVPVSNHEDTLLCSQGTVGESFEINESASVSFYFVLGKSTLLIA